VPQQVSLNRASALKRLINPGMALIFGLLLSGATAMAQPAPAGGSSDEPKWDAIRKGPLSVTDQATVTKWVGAQIDTIFDADDPAKPGLEFFKKIHTQMRAADADARFKDALGQTLAQAFTSKYPRPASANTVLKPLAPVFVLLALRQTGPPAAALPAFQAALADPTPAVRCQGMMGINTLQANPALTPAARTALVAPVQKTAAAETNSAVLARCYDFLRYVGDNGGAGQDLQIATDLVQILDARLTRIEKQGEFPAVVDAEAVVWLAGKARTPGLNNAQIQKDIPRVAARLLADAAYACANLKPSEQLKSDMERIAALVEEPLTALLKAKVSNATPPAPSVMESLTSTAVDQKGRVNAAIAKWIGADQTKGLLNDPFGLPIGMGIQRPAPTTSTAPAS
jgi:hypothetical protein